MKQRTLLLGAAVSGMLLAAGTLSSQNNQPANDKTQGKCMGVNSCKGKGDCHTKDHTCAGKNGCSGKGWKKMSVKECNDKKGKWEKL